MKKHPYRIVSLALTVVFLLLSFTSCAGMGKKVGSSTSEAGGPLSSTPAEDEKSGEKIIAEEEKQGIIADGMLGASGNKVDTYDGYLGYGYNILTAAFYNHKDIKTSHPVIDMDSLAKEGKVYVEKKSSQYIDGKTFVSSSARAYSENFAAAANINVKIGFAGSFDASFKMNHTVQMNSNQKLVTTQALLETQNDYIIDNDAELLASHATETFKKAVAGKTAEELISTYGTHVLANIALGGRFDLNYFYTRTETSETTDISASASASYRYVSGSVSAEDKKKKKEIDENSKIFIKAYGGSVTVNPTSIDAAVSSYKDWSTGVENGKVTFVNASEVIPLWDIIAALDIKDAAAKSAAVKQFFNARVDQISGEFKDTVNVTTYISDVYIGYGRSQVEAKNMLRNNGVSEGHIVNLDLNKGAGGYWIYLGYKTTTDKSKTITGIVADYFSKSNSSDITYKGCKYKIIPVDLNKGAKGKYIYIYYTTDPKAGNPVTEIKYQDNDVFQYGNSDGFEPVRCVTDGNVLDLNKGSGGDYIYLWFKRS